MLFMVMMSWGRLPKVARAAVKEARRNGRKARWFQDQDYEANLARPLADVRREMNVAAPGEYLALVAQALIRKSPQN